MRTPKSLVAGVGAGTSIVAAGSIALASVAGVVGVRGWTELRDTKVPQAIALASELGAGAADQAAQATTPGVLRIAGDAPVALAEASGTAAARRRASGRARLAPGDARRQRQGGADDGSVAGTNVAGGSARRGTGAPARPGGGSRPGTTSSGGDSRSGVVDQATRQAGDAVRETGKQAAPAVDAVVPGAGSTVQQTTEQAGKTVDQAGSTVQQTTDAVGGAVQQTTDAVGTAVQGATGAAGSAVQQTTQTAGSAVEQTTTTVTQAAGGLLRPRAP